MIQEIDMVNAIRLADGDVIPLNFRFDASKKLGFRSVPIESDGFTLECYNADGTLRWSSERPYGVFFSGGFDASGDGYIDIVVENSEPYPPNCSGFTTPRGRSWLDLLSGDDGSLIYTTVKVPDICNGTIDDTFRVWQCGSVMFGPSSSTIALVPHFWPSGNRMGYFWIGGGDLSRIPDLWYPPDNPSFQSYVNAEYPYPPNYPYKYIARCHPPNAIVMTYNNAERLAGFAEARALEYNIAPYTASQLRADCPFLATTLAIQGRNYGAVALDPQMSRRIVKVSGGSMRAYYDDVVGGVMQHDQWCGVERHLSAYDVSYDTVEERWISSYFLDAPYMNLARFPAHFTLPSIRNKCHVVWNKFDGTQWSLHITDAVNLANPDPVKPFNLVAWDCADIDGDGIVEVIASPTNGYFAQFVTRIYKWQPASMSLVFVRDLLGLPYIQQGLQEATTRVGPMGRPWPYIAGLCPVLVGDEGNGLGIYTRDQAGNIALQSL